MRPNRDTTYHDESRAFWLKELEAAHADLLNAIDELKKLTRGPQPSKQTLVDTRWLVSKASLQRRLLWGRIHALLSERANPDNEEELRELQEADMRLLRSSTTHIGTWTADAIIADWAGYCRASSAMRSEMTRAIADEKRLLYPILEEIGARV